MQKDKKWKVLYQQQIKDQNQLLKILLNNRNIKTKEAIDNFLNPKIEDVTADSVGIDKKQLKTAVDRIRKAIDKKEQIVVFGDYDVDGICGTAILWETLNSLGAKVVPYIPHRIEEGYGLSSISIKHLISQFPDLRLVVTVDTGIVANEAVEILNSKNIDVIITDHHVLGKIKPKALAIVHTTKLCGTGVAYLLSQEVLRSMYKVSSIKNAEKIHNTKYLIQDTVHLELVALATVADLVPLIDGNRTLLKFGLEQLHKTKRPGLLALLYEAGIEKENIGTYEIGHVIAPRLNAMGRLEHAMDSLRLICTTDKKRAQNLALLLSSTNRERQLVTEEAVLHAKTYVKENNLQKGKLLFVAHESYAPGVIGLVAGKLVEEFYRPAIVLSKGEKYSKASARSIYGFNIIEFIRQASEFLVDAGGHPMAAGFTVETDKLEGLQRRLEELAEKLLNTDHFVRNLRIDAKIPLSLIDFELTDLIKKLSPFGMKNPQPVFLTKKVVIEDMKLVGQTGAHIKFLFSQENEKIPAIAFGMGEMASKIHIGDKIDIIYSIEEDNWPARNASQREAGGNGNRRLQLKIKDLGI